MQTNYKVVDSLLRLEFISKNEIIKYAKARQRIWDELQKFTRQGHLARKKIDQG